MKQLSKTVLLIGITFCLLTHNTVIKAAIKVEKLSVNKVEHFFSRIQEVTYKVAGMGGTFFNYGDVLIQNAGAIPNFVFEDVPQPAHVAQILEELQEGKGGQGL